MNTDGIPQIGSEILGDISSSTPMDPSTTITDSSS